VAAEQIRSWFQQARRQASPGAAAPPPIFSFDAGYDSVQLRLAVADEPVGLRVRLRSDRCFAADPTHPRPPGRPRRHGAKFVCKAPTPWPEPTEQWSTEEAEDGQVQLQAWSGLHPIPQHRAPRGTRAQPHARPRVRGTLIRLEGERLPRPTKIPVPLWLWWEGPEPPDWAVIWQADMARVAIAHPWRCFKQTFKGTTPKVRRPEAADRWTWRRRLLLAFVQLRLARDQVADGRLLWQRPLPPAERRTPARVRRGVASLLPTLGRPVHAPQPGGTLAGAAQRQAFSTGPAVSGDQIAVLSRAFTERAALHPTRSSSAGTPLWLKLQAYSAHLQNEAETLAPGDQAERRAGGLRGGACGCTDTVLNVKS
jgi:hypothetical protein